MTGRDQRDQRAEDRSGTGFAHTIGLDEPIPAGVRRVVLGLIDGAMVDLQPVDPDAIDLGVHAARKKVKRIRALLRLVRDGIGQTIYHTENRSLRDTTRTISDLRDAAALIETLDGVAERHPAGTDGVAIHTTRRWLIDRYDVAHASTSPGVWSDAIRSLTAIRTRFAAYPLEDLLTDDFDSIGPGLRRTYRRGRRGHRRATEDPTVHTLHVWRKAVKYLRYQLETLSPIEPDHIGALAASLDELGERLGDDHDLAVLAGAVRTDPDACRTDAERENLMTLIEADRLRLHTEALAMGHPLYADRPKEFEQRMRTRWEAARA